MAAPLHPLIAAARANNAVAISPLLVAASRDDYQRAVEAAITANAQAALLALANTDRHRTRVIEAIPPERTSLIEQIYLGAADPEGVRELIIKHAALQANVALLNLFVRGPGDVAESFVFAYRKHPGLALSLIRNRPDGLFIRLHSIMIAAACGQEEPLMACLAAAEGPQQVADELALAIAFALPGQPWLAEKLRARSKHPEITRLGVIYTATLFQRICTLRVVIRSEADRQAALQTKPLVPGMPYHTLLQEIERTTRNTPSWRQTMGFLQGLRFPQ